MTEVLIAGAGPTGLVAAIELARRGVAVRIIDAGPKPFHGSRGKGLQPRTLEVFDDLGIVDEVLALGGPYLPIRVHAGRLPVWQARIGRIREPSGEVPYPNLLMIPQNHTERVLRRRLAGLGVEVEFGVGLTDFTQDAAGVTARLGAETVNARYLLGADGAHSTVRKGLGIPFDGETREGERMIVADVRLSGVDRKLWRAYVKPLRRRFMLAVAPLPGTELFQLIAPLRPGETPELTREAIQRRFAAAGAKPVRVSDVAWASVWRANIRLARRYRDGRVLIAGDAAHVHSPAGGQGLNTGVQDAYNLGWKLAAVLSGAADGLLDTYEAERFPVAAAVLGLSTRLHDAASAGVTKALKRGAETDQLGIHYRYSPLSVGERAGDRAADGIVTTPDGRRLRLFDLYRGPHWTLLAAAGLDETPGAATDPLPRPGGEVRVQRVTETPTGTSFTLVRPDGYIGLTCDTAAEVYEYLRGLTASSRSAA